MSLIVLRRVVLGVLGDVAEFARDADPLRDVATAGRGEGLDLLLKLLVAVRREDDFLQHGLLPLCIETAAGKVPGGAGDGTTGAGYHLRMPVNLREPWSIGRVEVPTRIVLAPMAGVSIQAFRRQGRRFGAGLVCSEMVSAAGIEHK